MTALASLLSNDSPLLAPLVGETPAGIDLTYDPEFERLTAEIDKLTSLAAEAPDWRFIDAECSRTLRDKSKDLRVMSWLVAAKANLEGWSGIASGLELYVALSRSFWPTLYPPLKRLRARAGQVEWLWGVLAKRITALPASDSDAEIVRGLEARIAELSAFFSEHLKDADPGMASLRTALREKIRTLPEPVAPPPPAPTEIADGAPSIEAGAASTSAPSGQAAQAQTASIAAAKPPPPPTIAAAASLASLDAAQDAARGLRDSMMTLAHHARQVAPASAWGYRVLRLAAWLTVEGAPEVEGGKTFLRAPRPQERELLDNLRAAGQWDGLLQASEEAAATHIFWLDPHRMSALALEHKGATFRQARDTVSRETARFIERVGDVAHLAFSNGTPFATPETADWLSSLASTASAAGAAAGAPRADDEATAAVLGELEERLKSGPAGDALANALRAADRLTDARGRFRAQLTIARRAETSDHLDVALLLYERMLPEVTPTLEQWEPGMSAELLGNYLKSLRVFLRNREAPPADSAEHAKYKEREAHLYKRLLILDPHAALRMRA